MLSVSNLKESITKMVDIINILDLAYIAAEEANDAELKQWILDELEGYQFTAELPNYRKIKENIHIYDPNHISSDGILIRADAILSNLSIYDALRNFQEGLMQGHKRFHIHPSTKEETIIMRHCGLSKNPRIMLYERDVQSIIAHVKRKLISWTTSQMNPIATNLKTLPPLQELSSKVKQVSIDKIPKTIFLSHKSPDKDRVRKYKKTLELLGFSVWLDEDNMVAGGNPHRDIKDGFSEACAVVFFITPNFKDDGWLAHEINLANQQKINKQDQFVIITIVLSDENGERGKVPDLLTEYTYKIANSDLDGLCEIIRALPIQLGAPGKKTSNISTATDSDNGKNFPSLILGEGKNYEDTQMYSNRLYRTISIGVKNNIPSDYLTNCKLYLDRVVNGKSERVLVADTFDLAPLKERYIKIASYCEGPNEIQRDKHITLHLPGHSSFGYENMPSIDEQHLIVLRLESSEYGAIENHYYLGIEEKTGKLNIKKI